jgi:hypothetical protein
MIRVNLIQKKRTQLQIIYASISLFIGKKILESILHIYLCSQKIQRLKFTRNYFSFYRKFNFLL